MTTFITCMFKLNNSKTKDDRKKVENRIKYFEELVSYGIQLCVVCCPYYEPYLKELTTRYENIKIIDVMNLSDTMIYKLCKEHEDKFGPLKLPDIRDFDKDNDEYFILMNSKVEFVKKAIDVNVWNSKYFCWIDFSIHYMIKDKQLFKTNIDKLSKYEMPLINELNIIIPGCEQKKRMVYIHPIWRYSGSIFYGYKDDLITFYEIYSKYYNIFLKEHSLLTWEVTVWAWFESIDMFNPLWSYGNHDDSITSFINLL
jgi:hypothetical protein